MYSVGISLFPIRYFYYISILSSLPVLTAAMPYGKRSRLFYKRLHDMTIGILKLFDLRIIIQAVVIETDL